MLMMHGNVGAVIAIYINPATVNSLSWYVEPYRADVIVRHEYI